MLQPSAPTELKLVRNLARDLIRDGGGAGETRGAPLPFGEDVRVDIAGLRAVAQSVARAVEVVEAAVAAAVSVEEVLRRLRALALEAADPTCPDRATLDQAFRAAATELPALIASAETNRINLLAPASAALEALLDADTGETVRIPGEDLTPGGPNLLFGGDEALPNARRAQMTAGLIGLSLANVERAVGRLALGARKLNAHGGFVRRLIEGMNDGIKAPGNEGLFDGARLRALSDAQRDFARFEASGRAASLLALFR